MKTLAIAMLCHSINAAYCRSLGDDTQPSWDDAPDWQPCLSYSALLHHPIRNSANLWHIKSLLAKAL